MLIRIVKNWTYPDLLRQTPAGSGEWDGIHFTMDPVEECDGVLVCNEVAEDITVRCPPENVWAILQEPYYPAFFPWMKDGHKQFSRVYTHHPPSAHKRYRVAHPLVPWHAGRSYNELSATETFPKTDRIVWVTSALQVFPGHLKRFAFYRFMASLGWKDLEIWGRGIRPIEEKWGVLAGSRYGIAIENYSGCDYWTEKIADCWLAGCLPFYHGCQNLEKYFPAGSFIRIDLDDFQKSARTIRQVVDAGDYEKHLSAISEARELVLNRYQFFPFIVKEIQEGFTTTPRTLVHLSAFRQNCLQRFGNHLLQLLQLHRVRNQLSLSCK